MATPTTDVDWEDDSVPSVITRTSSASGWVSTPNPKTHRGPYVTGVIQPMPLDPQAQQQDFSILGILEAQKGAKLVHQHSLVTVLYNLMKTKNAFDLNIIVQNDLEKIVCDFQREGSRWTFLMQAAFWNNDSVARWLLQHNTDPFIVNADNETALDVAMSNSNLQVAETIRIRMGEIQMKQRAAAAKPIPISPTQKMRDAQSL